MADVPVEVWQIVRDDAGENVVLLRDGQGRLLPISIGMCEAAAIWVRLTPDIPASFVRRPWSHDLMRSMVKRLGAKLTRVVIDDFSQGTFYATLHLERDGEETVVDARPSDAIALMLRMSSPLFVNTDVMDEEAYLFRAADGGMAFESPDDME